MFCCLAGCARTRATPPSDASPRETTATPAAAGKWLEGTDAYPDARKLCDEHVMGGSGEPPPGVERIREIHWVSYASTASPEEIASFYSARGMHLDGEHKYASGRFRLSVDPVSSSGYPKCSEGPKPPERSVIVLSLALP